MRRRSVVLVVCCLLLPGLAGLLGLSGAASIAGAAAQRAPVAGSVTGPDPYWRYDGNGGTDALRYDVRVAYDFVRSRLRGRTTVVMRATEELRSFSLDLLLPASSVRVDGRPASFSRPTRHELRVVPRSPIAAGEIFRVTVRYAGNPARRSYAGERNWLADRHEVVTVNQPHMAPWWFPSNDHPSDKARFDIRVTVPRGKQVVSNGVRVRRTVRGTLATTHWRMTDPMATYLAFFAAGDFTVESGRSAAGIRYVNAVSDRLSRSTRRGALRDLRRTAAVTDWLQARLGPYPFATTGGLVTSLDLGFALENQTRPIYGAWIHPSVVVHELAHQWFGDSVAVRRWRDIWLNEGFATYLEAWYREQHGGRSVNTWLHEVYDGTCEYDGAVFWTLDLDDPGPARLFHGAVYDRGAMVLAALRNVIGSAPMADLLRAWASEHRGGNASVPEFEAFAEERTGVELSAFFDAWLRGGAPPAGTAANGLQHACPA